MLRTVLTTPPTSSQAPWRQRRHALVARIASRGDTGLPVNLKRAPKTHTREADSRDLRRLLAQGLAVLSPKSRLPGRKQHKVVRLTPRGQALLGGVVAKPLTHSNSGFA